MKTMNLRADTPVIRNRIEVKGTGTPTNIGMAIGNLSGQMIRFKSITFRSSGIVLGEQEVKALGRTFFAMFKSNSYVASINFDGHYLGQWHMLGNTKTEGFSLGTGSVAIDPTNIVHALDYGYLAALQAPEGVTMVINYETVEIDILEEL